MKRFLMALRYYWRLKYSWRMAWIKAGGSLVMSDLP